MRDLELFQRLRNGDRRSPELLTALGELCEIGTRDRVPYFGSLVGLVEDEAVPVEIRNAALRALVGANGWMTVEAVVHALDEPSLREAALDVLRFVIETDPKRWVHAAFHRDPDVRRLALSGRRTPRVDPIEFYLLADPECRALLRDREPAVPRAQLTTLLDFVRAGHVTKNDARAMFARSPSVLETSLDAMRRRLPELVTQLLVGARSAPGFDAELARAHPDDLDTFLEVLPPEDTRAMRELSRLARNGHFEERLAVSAWASVASHDSPPKTTVELLYGLDPLSIAGASIPVAVAREVLTEMARWPGAFPHLSAELAGPLLALPVVTHPEGGIDLAVAGAIVQLVAKDGYTLAGSHLGMNAIVAALDARLEASLPFFYSATAKDGDPGARAILARLDEPRQPALPGLDAVAPEPAPPVSQKDVLVAMAEHAHHSRWQLLASAGAESLGHVLVRVGKSGVDADRSAKLAALAAKTLSIGALPRIVGPLLGDEEPSLEVTPPEPRLLFASAVLGAVSAVVESPVFVERFLALPPKSLFTALGLLGMAGAFQWPKELALADALLGHRDPRIARWAAERMPAAEVEVPRPPPRPGAGVAYRTPPPSPSVEACVLLLGSADPIGATDAAFPQWASDAPAFLAELDAALVNEFAHRDVALSPLGHAWLWRWDRHALAHFSLVLAAHESLAEGVRARSALTTRILRDSSIAAIASALMLLSFQNRPLLREVLSHDLVDALIDLLPGDAGESAADALRAIHRAQELDMRDALTKIRILLPDLAEGVRDRLGRLVDSSGLPPRRVQRAPEQGLAEEVLERIRTSVDLDALVRDTEDERMNVVHEATLRLIELGADGLERLAAIVVSARSCDRVRPIIESVPLWPEGPALALLEEHLRTEELAAEIRFRLAIAFAERHEPGAIDIAIAATLSSGDDRWFEPRDWDAMLRFVDSAKLSRSLAASPHPHAHVRALEWLLALPAPSENLDALRAFLATGTKRMGSLRRRAARVLLDEGDDSAFPLVLTQELEEATGRSTLLVSAGDDLVDLTATSILAAGTALAKEAALLRHLASISLFRAEPAFEIILRRGTVDKARIAAAGALSRGMSRERKLLKVVSTFSWGGRVGQRLLGKRMRVKMTGSQKLGFTRTRENVVYVSPLPMLRGDRQGTEIVEGLILHELGHHLYHAGPANEAVWETAKKEGIGGLLNLVADEHLERNMRAIDSEYGDKLKRLAAYAFQHNGRPIEVSGLLRHVGARAAEVIPQVHLGVARDPTTVLVESGSLLFLMERAGLSFVRFARALRMGLGNRHADPQVDLGLALFDGRFRHSKMSDLLEVSRKLREIFGWETNLCEDFGAHESLETGEGDVDSVVWGEGMTQEEVDRLVKRFTESETGSSGTGGGGIALNIGPEEQFKPITRVDRIPFDAAAHAPYARRVQRPAAMLRKHFDDLGISFVPEKRRTSGRRVDRARLVSMVVRGDPRALIARERAIFRDLFLGVVIDCSGSMAARDNMERAKLFAVLLAEATGAISGIDTRVFGFTDQVIYDCGDARRCSAHALVSGGGNNDAAALYHAASVAKNSRRQAKVLVMVSDGLPTECTVTALRALVARLGRREGMILAQVAVQPLAEVCFPHYVVLNDASLEITVHKFGVLVARLVQKALGV